jgi:hypothetical protein
MMFYILVTSLFCTVTTHNQNFIKKKKTNTGSRFLLHSLLTVMYMVLLTTSRPRKQDALTVKVKLPCTMLGTIGIKTSLDSPGSSWNNYKTKYVCETHMPLGQELQCYTSVYQISSQIVQPL